MMPLVQSGGGAMMVRVDEVEALVDDTGLGSPPEPMTLVCMLNGGAYRVLGSTAEVAAALGFAPLPEPWREEA
jgi:hypothetical protein